MPLNKCFDKKNYKACERWRAIPGLETKIVIDSVVQQSFKSKCGESARGFAKNDQVQGNKNIVWEMGSVVKIAKTMFGRKGVYSNTTVYETKFWKLFEGWIIIVIEITIVR